MRNLLKRLGQTKSVVLERPKDGPSRRTTKDDIQRAAADELSRATSGSTANEEAPTPAVDPHEQAAQVDLAATPAEDEHHVAAENEPLVEETAQPARRTRAPRASGNGSTARKPQGTRASTARKPSSRTASGGSASSRTTSSRSASSRAASGSTAKPRRPATKSTPRKRQS